MEGSFFCDEEIIFRIAPLSKAVRKFVITIEEQTNGNDDFAFLWIFISIF
jgi:hypothetical protein